MMLNHIFIDLNIYFVMERIFLLSEIPINDQFIIDYTQLDGLNNFEFINNK